MEIKKYSNWNTPTNDNGNVDDNFYNASMSTSTMDKNEEKVLCNLNGMDIIEDADGENPIQKAARIHRCQ